MAKLKNMRKEATYDLFSFSFPLRMCMVCVIEVMPMIIAIEFHGQIFHYNQSWNYNLSVYVLPLYKKESQ